MNFIYEVNDKNEILVFNTNSKIPGNPPVVFQPRHPDGRDWINRSEAEAWAKEYVDKANGIS